VQPVGAGVSSHAGNIVPSTPPLNSNMCIFNRLQDIEESNTFKSAVALTVLLSK
jgi:hypothetical protein